MNRFTSQNRNLLQWDDRDVEGKPSLCHPAFKRRGCFLKFHDFVECPSQDVPCEMLIDSRYSINIKHQWKELFYLKDTTCRANLNNDCVLWTHLLIRWTWGNNSRAIQVFSWYYFGNVHSKLFAIFQKSQAEIGCVVQSSKFELDLQVASVKKLLIYNNNVVAKLRRKEQSYSNVVSITEGINTSLRQPSIQILTTLHRHSVANW